MAGLFDPYTLKGMTLKNRVMMSPMCQYQGQDGSPSDWHLVHLGARAVGGVGLILFESTQVEARGRKSLEDLGLWSDEQIPAFQRVIDFCHQYGAKIGIQLAHAGGKAGVPGQHVAPSALPRTGEAEPLHELTVEEIGQMVERFKEAAVRAVKAGVDTVEIHGAHGYLVNQFLSPLTNHRTDEYGGSLENRTRFALDVIRAVKSVLPADMPLFMRVSAVEYSDEGYDLNEMVEMCKLFKEAGVDIIDVSTGGNVPNAPTVYPGYQLQYADVIRKGADVPTIAVGLMDSPALAEEALRNGRCDIVAIGRGLMRNAHWAKDAATALGVEMEMPNTYKRAY